MTAEFRAGLLPPLFLPQIWFTAMAQDIITAIVAQTKRTRPGTGFAGRFRQIGAADGWPNLDTDGTAMEEFIGATQH